MIIIVIVKILITIPSVNSDQVDGSKTVIVPLTRSRDLRGPMRSISKVEKVKENYKNNEVMTITSTCVCARDSLVMRHGHTHILTLAGFSPIHFFVCSSLHPSVTPLPLTFIIPLFIHYFRIYILILFYNIYPFIPIKKKFQK